MDKLLKYLNALSKAERALFVAACETSESYLRKAVSTGQHLNPSLCIDIERESSGAVTCEDMRPTGVDWAYIRSTQPTIAAPIKTALRRVPPP